MKKECYQGNLKGYRIQTTTLLEKGFHFYSLCQHLSAALNDVLLNEELTVC